MLSIKLRIRNMPHYLPLLLNNRSSLSYGTCCCSFSKVYILKRYTFYLVIVLSQIWPQLTFYEAFYNSLGNARAAFFLLFHFMITLFDDECT